MGVKYKDTTTGNFVELGVKVGDTLPVGSEVDYDGETVPTGWEEVNSVTDYDISDYIATGITFNSNYSYIRKSGSNVSIQLMITSTLTTSTTTILENLPNEILDTSISQFWGIALSSSGGSWIDRITVNNNTKTLSCSLPSEEANAFIKIDYIVS